MNEAKRPTRGSRVPLVRRLRQAAVDAGLWLTSFIVVYYVLPHEAGGGRTAVGVALLAAGVHVGVGYALGLYQGRFWYGSSRELIRVYGAAGAATAAGVVAVALRDDLDAGVAQVLLAAPLMLAAAQVIRVLRWMSRRERRPSADPAARRLLVFGAGDAGEMALRALAAAPSPVFQPVALLDDDPSRRRLEIHHVRVLGNRNDIAEVAAATGADAMLIAISSATGDTLLDLTSLAQSAGLEVFVVPPVADLFGGFGAEDIRPVTELDLLGRHPVEIDLDTMAGFVTGRRVLITGAGGSIGSELCRQVERFAPSALYMLDCDDSGLHGVQLALEGRALLQSDQLILADIRDRDRVAAVVSEVAPDVIFHAAALKHLSLLERHPSEAWKSNVHGTLNLLDAAVASGVGHFVNISTDKAADPSCVLGWSKRITERLTAHAGQQSSLHYVSVRFGNVLGSRGSVLGIFDAQLRAGGPLTVTDEDVTRYFMTVAEAVRLTIHAAAIGRTGQVMVLDMGHPVRIVDVARRLAASSRRPVDIVFTGLRPGEKLHETLLGQDEPDRRPHHPMISEVDVPPLDPESLRGLDSQRITADTLAAVSAASPAPR
jgi:FlaA1/EpsC-like NDP-sugar epimerase